jgi:hypothetical protein
MSCNYDIEVFRNSVIKLIQNELNIEITKINLEKDDDFSILDIAPENYYNDISDQVLNVSPFIYYGFVSLDSSTTGTKTQTTITMFISVVFDNSNTYYANDYGTYGSETETKVLRYTRALKEVIQNNYKKFAWASPLSVTEFTPQDFELNKGSDFKVGGIHVTGTIYL